MSFVSVYACLIKELLLVSTTYFHFTVLYTFSYIGVIAILLFLEFRLTFQVHFNVIYSNHRHCARFWV